MMIAGGCGPLLTTMLGEMLGTEVSGTTNSSAAVTFHRGAVVPSGALRARPGRCD